VLSHLWLATLTAKSGGHQRRNFVGTLVTRET
jgi:hypothetical protein